MVYLRFPDEGILFAVETSCCSWRLVDGGAGRPEASAAAPEVELLNEDVDGTLEPPPPPPEASSVPPQARRLESVGARPFRRLELLLQLLGELLVVLAFLQEYASFARSAPDRRARSPSARRTGA